MKAAFIEEQGPPEVIRYGDLPDPVAGPKQVLVRVRAVAVNPIDLYLRGGMVPVELNFPYIVGCDLAGEVVGVGSDVSRFQVGDRVWGSNQGIAGRNGSFAELVAVDQEWLYPTPDAMSDTQAAAGALVGITAHLGLFLHGRLQSGEHVFVNGGAGGVGSAVIQLAKARGARVATTVGSEANEEYCRELGADTVLHYRDDGLDEALYETTRDQGIDLWFETQREPNPERTIGFMARRGRVILMAGRNARPLLPVGPTYTHDLSWIGFAMFNATPVEQATAAEHVNTLAASGRWQANIGLERPLSEAAEAHRILEQKTLHGEGSLRGKIVLIP